MIFIPHLLNLACVVFSLGRCRLSQTPPPLRLFRLLLLAALFWVLLPRPVFSQLPSDRGITLSTGIYAAEGFGVNPYGALRYNQYFSQGRHFVEMGLGLSSLRSQVLESVSGAKLFESNRLISYEIVYGYDPRMWSSTPYFLGGVAGLNQGGQSKFAAVLGIGNRLYFKKLFGSGKLGLRYELRDHLLTQRFNRGSSFLAHNLIFTLNLEYFY